MVRALYKAAAVAGVAVLLGLLRGSDGGTTYQFVESYTPLMLAEETRVSYGPSPYCVWRDDASSHNPAPVPLQNNPVKSLYACHELCSGNASCVGVSTNSRPGSTGEECALVSAEHLSEFRKGGGATTGCLSNYGHSFYTKVTTRFDSSCLGEYDLVWVVDESRSVGDTLGEAHWGKLAALLNDATASLSRSGRRVLGSSLVQYFGIKANALERTEDPAGFQVKMSEHMYSTGGYRNTEQGLVKGLAARRELGKDRKVVVVLVTDGMPNSSNENGTVRSMTTAINATQLAARDIIAEANTTLVYYYISYLEWQETLFDRSEIITLRNMPSGFSDSDVWGLFANAGAATPSSVRADEAYSPPSWVVTMGSESDAIAAVTFVKSFQGNNLTKYITLYPEGADVTASNFSARLLDLFDRRRAPRTP
jgi:hypothetical protein